MKRHNAFPSVLSALFHAALYIGICYVFALVLLGFITP
jgi:hypothetical protein